MNPPLEKSGFQKMREAVDEALRYEPRCLRLFVPLIELISWALSDRQDRENSRQVNRELKGACLEFADGVYNAKGQVFPWLFTIVAIRTALLIFGPAATLRALRKGTGYGG